MCIDRDCTGSVVDVHPMSGFVHVARLSHVIVHIRVSITPVVMACWDTCGWEGRVRGVGTRFSTSIR